MYIVLFILYFGLACYGILKIPFFQKSGIKPGILLLIFSLHVCTGCIHNIIAYRFYPGHGDIWSFFQKSIEDRYLLLHDIRVFTYNNSTWTYFSHNGIALIDLILNIFSFQNLYIDTLLFSFPIFLGNIALFRVFRHRFPNDPMTSFATLLLPSTLFWTSCLHREGMIYMLLGFLLFHLDRLFTTGWNKRLIVYSLALLVLITYYRISVTVALVPAILIWWVSENNTYRRKWLILAGCLLLPSVILILFKPDFFHPLLKGIAGWQQEFQVLEGHSRLYLPVLDGSPANFWDTLPFAILNGFFEPLPGSGGRNIYLIFSLELILIWCMTAIAVFRWLFRNHSPAKSLARIPSPANFPARIHSPAKTLPFNLFCLVFVLIGILEVGYIVPFAGAIVRYRSIYLPFLLAPFLHLISPLFSRANSLIEKHLIHPRKS